MHTIFNNEFQKPLLNKNCWSLGEFSVRRKAWHLETEFCCFLDMGCMSVKAFLTVKDMKKPQTHRILKDKWDGR